MSLSARVIGELIAAVAVVVGLTVWVWSATTGYLAGRPMEVLPLILGGVASAALVIDIGVGRRLPQIASDSFVIGSLTAVLGGLAVAVLDRVPLAADVYFIPINYPRTEELALNLSIIACAAYLVAAIALVVVACARDRVVPLAV